MKFRVLTFSRLHVQALVVGAGKIDRRKMGTMTVQQALELATRHFDAGRLREAELIFRQILSAQPAHPEALRMLGLVAHHAGQHAAAAELIGRAIALNPNAPDYRGNLGVVLASQGRLDDAIDAFRQGLAMRPNDPQGMTNLANALQGTGALAEAISLYRKALALRPELPQAWYNLGRAHHESGQFASAIESYDRVLRLQPAYPDAHYNLGNALKESGRLDEAVAAYRQALSIRPHHAEARWNLGLLLLAQGDFENGWPAYEARRQIPHLWGNLKFDSPLWDGGELGGRRILLRAEQGLGDTIQFIRYAPMVAARGGRVLLQCQPELLRLMEGQTGVDRVVSFAEPPPGHDVYCPLLSLPGRFGTTLATIPAPVPYVFADVECVGEWKRRLAQGPHALRVGLNWAGNPFPPANLKRSMPLSVMAPLGKVAGVQFHNLQKGAAAAEAGKPPPGLQLVNPSTELNDLADTAGLIANLNLVITCDTSVAHLAGAMGKPVWVALPFAADWRWLLGRADSPWYPTMRLFRQPSPGDWESPMRQMAKALDAICHSGFTRGRE